MFIAPIAIDRGEAVPDKHRFKNIGDVFWDETKRKATLKLTGFPLHHAHTFLANYQGSGEAPNIEGDLMVCTGEFRQDGSLRKAFQWIGYIHTSQEHSAATQYWGQILIAPVVRTVQPVDKAMPQHYVYAHVFEEE